MKITGKVTKVDIGPGCWGIIDSKGSQYRPVNFPSQLKHSGKQVSVVAEIVEEDFSLFQWGTAVKIISFST